MDYERVNWENLPSTKTPVNADNLNKLNDAIDQAGAEIFAGAEEPTTGEKVWFRKGKNLFNKNVSIITGYLFSDDGNMYPDEESWYQSVFIEVNSKTQYTISSTVALLRIGFYDKDRKFISREATTNTSITFSTPENCKYVRLSGKNVNTQVQSLQLEQGSKATSYEAYIEPKIFVRNSNGVYEEFIKKHEEVYSTSETKIGTWINGKPLYRKVYTGTKVSGHNNTISLSNLNIDYVNFYGFLIGNQGTTEGAYQFPINYYENSNAFIKANIHRKYMNLTIVSAASTYFNGDYIIVVEYTKTTD